MFQYQKKLRFKLIMKMSFKILKKHFTHLITQFRDVNVTETACASFGVIMLTFFFCKKSMEQRKEKIQSVVVKKEKFEPSPIVKDYQRVPSDTKEYLENREETHIEMYKESNQETQATSEPLISS